MSLTLLLKVKATRLILPLYSDNGYPKEKFGTTGLIPVSINIYNKLLWILYIDLGLVSHPENEVLVYKLRMLYAFSYLLHVFIHYLTQVNDTKF